MGCLKVLLLPLLSVAVGTTSALLLHTTGNKPEHVALFASVSGLVSGALHFLEKERQDTEVQVMTEWLCVMIATFAFCCIHFGLTKAVGIALSLTGLTVLPIALWITTTGFEYNSPTRRVGQTIDEESQLSIVFTGIAFCLLVAGYLASH